MAKQPLFTAGYAGCDQSSFLRKLREHSIEVLVDVRRNPVSRKRGFSKSALQAFLDSSGIRYVHRRELGAPEELRGRLRDGGSLREYFDGFRGYLGTQHESIRWLVDLAKANRCCLMCLEALARECHRSVVTEVLLTEPDGEFLEVEHL